MKKLYLVYDQDGMIQAYPTFKEGKDAFDHMCSAHIKIMSDNTTFSYKRFKKDVDDNQIFTFKSFHRAIVKGKIRFINTVFSFQVIKVEE